MKFFIDQNLTHQLTGTVAALHRDHEFRSALEEKLTAVDDIPLYAILVDRGFQAIITRDRAQMADDDEFDALIACGLHWLGVTQPKVDGLLSLALDTAAVTLGLTHVLHELDGEQMAFRFKTINHEYGQRVKKLRLDRPTRK